MVILLVYCLIKMAYDLKSESEVKEYIHNLGIEYRFGCYSEKKPEGNNFNLLL